MRIAILGAGAWGSALAISLSKNNKHHEINFWVRDRAQAEAVHEARENKRYLPGFSLTPSIQVTHDFNKAVLNAQLYLIATPLSGLRSTLQLLKNALGDIPVILACKGLEAGTGLLPHQVVAEELGAERVCGVLSGPSFAEEVAKGLPTALVLASSHPQFNQLTAMALHDERLRLYTNDDLIGIEIGGAVKNIMAIAVGISDGMGFGSNAGAALMTRGLAEIARLGSILGGKHATFMGLAGMGDLVLTCTGGLSRNRRVGLALARGESLADVLRHLGHTAEGVSSAREVAILAERLDVEMPITFAVRDVLYKGLPPQKAVERLLARDPKSE